MKSIYKIIALSLLLVFTGCEDWLDKRPENDIILEDFWKSESDVESVLATCYRGLTERACIERMMVWGELRSDNIVNGKGFASGIYDMYRILQGEITPNNAYNSWNSFYAVINYCNTLLYYAPEVTALDDNFTQKDLQLIQGEAITLRALAYFYLVRTFRDIPWITDPSISDVQDYNVSQSPEGEVLDNIINDLEYVKANGYVRESFGKTVFDKGRITKSAVNALLADVYLWKGDFEKSIDACNAVLADPNISLITDPEQMFGQIFYRTNSSESIFELQFEDDDMENTAVNDLYGNNGIKLGYFAFPTPLAYDNTGTEVFTGANSPFNYKLPDATFESSNDVRSEYFINPTATSGVYAIFKYAGMSVNKINSKRTYYYRSNTSNWIIYRLSDIILMKAEALVQLQTGSEQENLQEAVRLVNQTYLRSNPEADSLRVTALNYSSKQAIEELVLRERQRELLFEGKRWHDLVRMVRRDESKLTTLNLLVNAKMESSTAPLGAVVLDAMYMPIAQSEIDANENLNQNEYYETVSSVER
ncbi:MAG: RagB/SusD family nutrient uptake outer membrane protein [Marinilabiliaceae bacterium]|nr:RagB/SusD family nutrient uptake outer membrane protein [Marinilabiliaceae bacterium]MBN2819106.1 RagB/SusD family nutrient uptake outer membrane protein [Bacteroidales bacterium]